MYDLADGLERAGEPAAEGTCFAQTADSLEPLLAAAGQGVMGREL